MLQAQERIVDVPCTLTVERAVEVPMVQVAEVVSHVPKAEYQYHAFLWLMCSSVQLGAGIGTVNELRMTGLLLNVPVSGSISRARERIARERILFFAALECIACLSRLPVNR